MMMPARVGVVVAVIVAAVVTGVSGASKETMAPPPDWEISEFGVVPQPRAVHPDSIFVSVAAYHDAELEPTIMDMLDKAEDPYKVVFGIMAQDDPSVLSKPYSFESRADFNGRVLRLDGKDTRGTCWARHIIQTEMFGDEKYYMQLDSHHRFDRHWDKQFKKMLVDCDSAKPILTAYGNDYRPGQKHFPKSHITRLTGLKFYETGKVRIVPNTVPGGMRLKKPGPAIPLISGHFIFCDGNWVKEVPYDPFYIFEGEEDSLGFRSFTHGWDIFYPHRPVVWHYFNRPGSKRFPLSHSEKLRAEARLRVMAGSPGEPWPTYPDGFDFGKYGIGTERTMEEFALKSGIFWDKRYLHSKALSGDPEVVITPEELAEIKNMTPWAVTDDCGHTTRDNCWEGGCRWVQGYPGPWCQYAYQPLKDCGHPGVDPHGCEHLGCKWVENGPGPKCQYGIPEYKPGHLEEL